ncbi:unnamed protein product, partial [Cladocopium goreaui]
MRVLWRGAATPRMFSISELHVNLCGFKHVYKLKGGIQHYGNTIGSEGWKGRLFVFDRRNSVPVGEGAAKLQHCSMCGQSNPAEEFWNCANVDCNRCMVTCRSCLVGANGCCCKECREATRQLSKAIWKIGGTSAFNAMQGNAPKITNIIEEK